MTPYRPTLSAQVRLFLVIAVALLALPSIPAAAQLPACRPTDHYSAAFLGDMAYFATAPATNAYAADQRLSKGIPSVDSSQVFVVTDSASCSQARSAYAAAVGLDPIDLSVVIVQVGSYFVVVDPTVTAGEWKLAKTFTSTFVKTKDFAW